MSTIDEARPGILPTRIAGQRLERPTFHARYKAMSPDTRAELVGGVVSMPSPMRRDHAVEGHIVSGWLFHYERHTSGVKGASGATVLLDNAGEPQPDALLHVVPELGGQASVDAEGYITGAPELVVEIARASRSFDLGPKRDDYERAGVRDEYLVVELDPDRIHWFVHRGDRFEDVRAGADGIVRSEVFPGLWLDPVAIYHEDLDRLIGVLEQGLGAPEHAAFVARLTADRSETRKYKAVGTAVQADPSTVPLNRRGPG